MLTILVALSIWVLLNILFVVIVVPARKPRSRLSAPGPALSAVPIDKSQGESEADEAFSLRHIAMSVAMGAFFVLVPPLMALRDAVARFWNKGNGGDRR